MPMTMRDLTLRVEDGEPWTPHDYITRFWERYQSLRTVTRLCTATPRRDRDLLPMNDEVAETLFALFRDVDEMVSAFDEWQVLHDCRPKPTAPWLQANGGE